MAHLRSGPALQAGLPLTVSVDHESGRAAVRSSPGTRASTARTSTRPPTFLAASADVVVASAVLPTSHFSVCDIPWRGDQGEGQGRCQHGRSAAAGLPTFMDSSPVGFLDPLIRAGCCPGRGGKSGPGQRRVDRQGPGSCPSSHPTGSNSPPRRRPTADGRRDPASPSPQRRVRCRTALAFGAVPEREATADAWSPEPRTVRGRRASNLQGRPGRGRSL